MQGDAVAQTGGAGAGFLFAGDEDFVARDGGAGGFDIGGEVARLGDEALGTEMGRVQVDREHAVADDAAAALGNGAGRTAAGEHAGEDVAHEGEAGAFVFAEGMDGARGVARLARATGRERAVEGGRIGGEGAVGGDKGAGGERFAAVGSDQDFAFGDEGGGEVEQQRRAAGFAGDADAERIGGKAAVDAAERGRMTPWLSWLVRLAETRWWPMRAASSGSQVAAWKMAAMKRRACRLR